MSKRLLASRRFAISFYESPPHPTRTATSEMELALHCWSRPRTAEVTEYSCVSGEEDEEKFMHNRYSSAMGCCRLLVLCG